MVSTPPPGWRVLHDEAEDGVWTVLLQAWWDPWGWHVATGEAPTRDEALRLAISAAEVEDRRR